jgi:hypothetical protein
LRRRFSARRVLVLLGLRSLRKLVKKEEKRRKRMFMLRRVGQGDGAPQGEEREMDPNFWTAR